MSADNEIAVVMFKDGSYRVAEIRGCPDMNEISSFLKNYYGDFAKQEFKDGASAFCYADDLLEKREETGGYVEYGITFYGNPDILNFVDYKPS